MPSTIAVYVFGSLAAGTLTADSDVDLAVLAPQPLAGEARWHLAQSLAIGLGRDVDLVDLRQASTLMRVQVLGSGQLLLELDRGARQEFEAVALAAYARLNEERRGIIDDIRARGSVMDDIVLNKAASIERCLRRIGEEYEAVAANLEGDLTRQDSIILNIQRACEASIDLAMHLVRKFTLGIPQDSRQAFDLLAEASKLDPGAADALERMVGFRSIAVHDYQKLNLQVVRAIVEQAVTEPPHFGASC